MKQIQTTKATILVVDVPEGAQSLLDFEIVTNQSVIPYGKQLGYPDGNYKSFPNHGYVDLPAGNWKLLGRANELTEKQLKQIFPNVIVGHRQCFVELLSANGIVLSNPYSNFECPNQWCENGYIDQGYNEYWRCFHCQENEDLEEEAQSKVTNPLILIKT